MQSAATLPRSTCTLAPIDLYNLLFALRTRKAKKAPRALRFELVPGAPPRIVVEPWELVLECHGPVYTGSAPRWCAPSAASASPPSRACCPTPSACAGALMGPGLPVFWVVDMGPATLTLALTGWTESGWSCAAAFDALIPRAAPGPWPRSCRGGCARKGPLSFEALLAGRGRRGEGCVRAALQLECLRGRVLYDIARRVPAARAARRAGGRGRHPLRQRARGARPPAAGEGAGEVKLTKVHEVVGEGTHIHGEVVDREAVRSFFPRFTLDLEGRAHARPRAAAHLPPLGDARGPLRAHDRAAPGLRAPPRRGRGPARRRPRGASSSAPRRAPTCAATPPGREQVYRVSLDGKVVAVEWGPRAGEPRHQSLWFDTDAEAREAYFGRLDRCLRGLHRRGLGDVNRAGKMRGVHLAIVVENTEGDGNPGLPRAR